MLHDERIAKINNQTQKLWQMNQEYKGHGKKDIDWHIGQILEQLYQIGLIIKQDEV